MAEPSQASDLADIVISHMMLTAEDNNLVYTPPVRVRVKHVYFSAGNSSAQLFTISTVGGTIGTYTADSGGNGGQDDVLVENMGSYDRSLNLIESGSFVGFTVAATTTDWMLTVVLERA